LDGVLGEYFRNMESKFVVFAPFRLQERLIGLLGLEYVEMERHFSASEIVLLEKICADISQIYENAQRFEQNRVLAATEERNRLARDLHDSVTQVLFAANLVAEVLPRIWVRDPELGQKSLEELRRLTRGALAEMRTMLLDLRPAAVIKTPLNELLAQLTEAVTGRSGLIPQLSIKQVPPLPEEVHICFYRVAQESLNNVIKHAKASHVSISLTANPIPTGATDDWNGEVKLVVSDNGSGIIPQAKGTQRFGLGIMRERAADIHADLFVDSHPGQGTTITLLWKS
jgi:signal transduction histidine kinase